MPWWWYGRRAGPGLKYMCGPASQVTRCTLPVSCTIVAAAQRPVAAAGACAGLQDQRRYPALRSSQASTMPAMPAPMMTIPAPVAWRQLRRTGIGVRDRQQAHRRHGAVGRRDAADLADPMDQRRGAANGHDGRRARRAAARVAVVEHVERAADRHALRDAGHGDAEWLEPVGQPVRGRGAIDRGAEGENHLGHAALRDARQAAGRR